MTSELLAADARTATLANSIWRGVTEKAFQRQIFKLWRLTKGRPKDPIEYILPTRGGKDENVLSVVTEVELAEGFAFIAAVRKGVETVSAAAIGLPKNSEDSLMIYIASNDVLGAQIRDKFNSIVLSMRKVASREITSEECKDRILTSTLEMNGGHISARLISKKKAKPIVLQGLQDILNVVVRQNTQAENLSILETRLTALCESVKQFVETPRPDRSTRDLEALVLECYRFWSAPGTESTKSMLKRAGVNVDAIKGNPHLQQIAKVAAYYYVSAKIAATASRLRFQQLFCGIAVQYTQAFTPVPSITPRDIAGGGKYCRVHAEVQLIVKLDLMKQSKWQRPLVIGSSKAACFLCDLFMQNHGTHFVPRSHGQLTPFWTIPDLDTFDAAQRNRYRAIVRGMYEKLRELATMSHPLRLVPASSWLAFSRLNLLQHRSQVPTPVSASSIQSEIVPSVLDRVMLETPSFVIPEMALTQHSTPANTSVKRVTLADGYLSASDTGTSTLKSPPERQNDSFDQRQQISTNSLSHLCKKLASDMPIAEHPQTSYSVSTSRRLEFDNLELFMDIESPATVTIFAMLEQEPQCLSSRVIDADKLSPNHELVLDFEADSIEEKSVFLKFSGKLRKTWLKITW